jgi:hypothetical protein
MFTVKLPTFSYLTLLLFLIINTLAYSQSKRESIPAELIGSWSVEDPKKKEDHEMMMLSITQDSVGLVYINFLEAIYGLACTYRIIPMNGITQIKLGKCTPKGELSSI